MGYTEAEVNLCTTRGGVAPYSSTTFAKQPSVRQSVGASRLLWFDTHRRVVGKNYTGISETKDCFSFLERLRQRVNQPWRTIRHKLMQAYMIRAQVCAGLIGNRAWKRDSEGGQDDVENSPYGHNAHASRCRRNC